MSLKPISLIGNYNFGHAQTNVKLVTEKSIAVEDKLDDRNIYFMLKLPNEVDLGNYKNKYIFIYDDRAKSLVLNYIDPQGVVNKLEYAGNRVDAEFLQRTAKDENTTLDKMISKEQYHRLWTIIACNEGHTYQGYKLHKEDVTPTDPNQMVVDLHSLQATQAGNIVNSVTNQGFFRPDAEEKERVAKIGVRAGWPLFGYEAIAYKVPPQNIIAVVKVQRKNLEHGSQSMPGDQHLKTDSYEWQDKSFEVIGDIQLNESFCSHQKLFYGEGKSSHEVELNYESDSQSAISTFENAKNKANITPDVYYGLGGKTL